MKNTSYGYLSPIKKILNIFSPFAPNDYFPARVEVDISNEEIDMVNISTIPRFRADYFRRNEFPGIELIITQAAKRADDRERLLQARKRVLHERRVALNKAEQYNIPYDKEDPDFLYLINEIEDYEFLLRRADELGIDWHKSNYDVRELEDSISAAYSDLERANREESNQRRRDYYESIRLV